MFHRPKKADVSEKDRDAPQESSRGVLSHANPPRRDALRYGPLTWDKPKKCGCKQKKVVVI